MSNKTEQLIRELKDAEARGDQAEAIRIARRISANKARRDRDQAMRDIGLVKVRGNLGGTYWE